MAGNKPAAAIAITASLPELMDALGVSRSTAYTTWLADPTFPRPIGAESHAKRWALRQFVDWMNRQGGGQITVEDVSATVVSRRASAAQSRKRKVSPQPTAQ